MTDEQEQQIEQDIRDEVKWLENDQVHELSEGAIATIMAILRVRLNTK
jgi:hypothetical protein